MHNKHSITPIWLKHQSHPPNPEGLLGSAFSPPFPVLLFILFKKGGFVYSLPTSFLD